MTRGRRSSPEMPMTCWKYLLVAVVLVSRIVELSLYYVSGISDWCWYLFTGGWFLLLFFALWSLLRLRWRKQMILSLVLFTTALPAINIGTEYITRFQDEVFRFYALHLIRAVPLEAFLAKCRPINYVDDEGNDQQVGQCDEGLRSIPRLYLSLIYDPSGQFSLPGYRRSTTWRLAVQGWTGPGPRAAPGLRFGSVLAGTNGRAHLVGNFYYAKLYAEEWKGDSDD